MGLRTVFEGSVVAARNHTRSQGHWKLTSFVLVAQSSDDGWLLQQSKNCFKITKRLDTTMLIYYASLEKRHSLATKSGY